MITGLFATAFVAGCGDDEESSSSGGSTDSGTDTADLGLIEDGTLIVGSATSLIRSMSKPS